MAPSTPLSPETLAYGTTLPSEPQISPNGQQIAYTLTTVDGETRRRCNRVWLQPVEGGEARPLTPKDQSASAPRWSPDGAALAVTVDIDDSTAIRVLHPTGEDAPRELTRHIFGIDDVAWSPDGTRLVYTTDFDPEDPDERGPEDGPPTVRVTRRIDYKQDGRGYLGDRRSHVFVVDVSSGQRSRLTTELVDHQSPQWSPDGRMLALVMARTDQQGAQLVLLDVESGKIQPITSAGGIVASWAWSPDAKRLVYVGDPDHTLQPDFFVYRVADRHTRRLTDDLQAELDDPPVWAEGDHVLFHSVRAGCTGLEQLDAETGSTELLEQSASRGGAISVDAAARLVVQARTTLTSTGDIILLDRQAKTTRPLTEYAGIVLDDQPPALWEKLSVPNEGFMIDAWLLKPPDFNPTSRYPVILDVHGGPSSSHGPRFIDHQQCWATHGFLVISPNPRGSTSYGRHFARQVIRDWGGGDFRDLMAVTDAVLERPYADAERTGIFGISYGGYLTAWTISQTDRFRAAICGEPIFDLESDYGTSDVAFNGLERHGGGPPHAEPEWYAYHSPSTYAHQTRTPTLIFHGEADARCPIGQSEQMFTALKKAGCEVEYVRYPGGSHMFFLFGPPPHRADFLARTLAWFSEHLGGPAAAPEAR